MKFLQQLCVLFLLTLSPLQAAELLVVEQAGCVYCELFNEQIAQAYPNTEEGKRAPMQRIDLAAPWPKAYANIKNARVTPTFILVENNVEIDRINGYPGDEHFWFLLGEMLAKLPTGQDLSADNQ